MAKVTVSAKTHTFTNGTANDATPVDASFTTLFNNDDALKTAVNHLEDGNLNETATLTLNANYGGGSPSSNGVVQIERGTLGNAIIRWNETSDCWQASPDAVNYFSILPKNFKEGCVVSYDSANAIVIGTGSWADSTNKVLIDVVAPLTANLTVSGANGLDSGSEASSTWYYVYLIMKSSDGTVASLLSTVNESASGSISLPTGYDLKRQLPIALRNNSSGDLLPFMVSSGWPGRPRIIFMHADMSATYRVLNGLSNTSFTNVSCSSLVPPLSRLTVLYGELDDNGDTGNMAVREPSSSSVTGQEVVSSTGGGSNSKYEAEVSLDASQNFQYKVSDSDNKAYAFVKGYIVTQMS